MRSAIRLLVLKIIKYITNAAKLQPRYWALCVSVHVCVRVCVYMSLLAVYFFSACFRSARKQYNLGSYDADACNSNCYCYRHFYWFQPSWLNLKQKQRISSAFSFSKCYLCMNLHFFFLDCLQVVLGGKKKKKNTFLSHTHTVHGGPWREYLHVTFSLQIGIVLQKTCRETCLNRFWE